MTTPPGPMQGPPPPPADDGGFSILPDTAEPGILGRSVVSQFTKAYGFLRTQVEIASKVALDVAPTVVEGAAKATEVIDWTSEKLFGEPLFPQFIEGTKETDDFLRAVAQVMNTDAFKGTMVEALTVSLIVFAVSKLPGGPDALRLAAVVGVASGRITTTLITDVASEFWGRVMERLQEDGLSGVLTEALVDAEEYADPTGFRHDLGALQEEHSIIAELPEAVLMWSRNAALPIQYRVWGRNYYRRKAAYDVGAAREDRDSGILPDHETGEGTKPLAD